MEPTTVFTALCSIKTPFTRFRFETVSLKFFVAPKPSPLAMTIRLLSGPSVSRNSRIGWAAAKNFSTYP